MRKINISEFNEIKKSNMLDFCLNPKDKVISDVLVFWIKKSLKNKKIKTGDLMPKKNEIAHFFNVSTSTIQNAFKYIEDEGYLSPKQRVGTIISGGSSENSSNKMFSKKDVIENRILKSISNCKLGALLPSTRKIARRVNVSHNTTRLVLNKLEKEGFIKKKIVKPNEIYYEVLKNSKGTFEDNLKKKTIAEILKDKIKTYVQNNCKIMEKIPKNETLAKMFDVSSRSVNMAIKILNDEGILFSRRGKYGTIYLSDSKNNKKLSDKRVFMSDTKVKMKSEILYDWERILKEIQKFIVKNYEAGDKLPTIKELAKKFETSTNTIRIVIKKLSENGILITQRGKNGGVFINDIDSIEVSDTYTWLAYRED